MNFKFYIDSENVNEFLNSEPFIKTKDLIHEACANFVKVLSNETYFYTEYTSYMVSQKNENIYYGKNEYNKVPFDYPIFILEIDYHHHCECCLQPENKDRMHLIVHGGKIIHHEEFMRIVNVFDKTWWYDNCHRSNGLLSIIPYL